MFKMDRAEQVYPYLLLILLFASVAAQREERWVWGGQRPARQIDPARIPSFLPPPSPRAPAAASTLLAPSASSLIPRRRGPAPRPSFSVAPEARPDAVPPPSRIQGRLLFRPLPIDISKLPLETSEPSDSLEGLGHPRGVPLVPKGDVLTQDLRDGGALSGHGHQAPVLGLTKTHFSQIPQNFNFGRPSALRQPEPSLAQTLVNMPDISKLPLESSSSEDSFLSSGVGGLNASIPTGVSVGVGVGVQERNIPSFAPSRGESVFLQDEAFDASAIRSGRLVPEVFQQPRAATPSIPSATPLPARILLQDFSILNDSPNVEGNRIFQTSSFENLEKEFSSQNSKAIDQAFRNIKLIPADANGIQVVGRDPVVFPKQIENFNIGGNGSPIHVVNPPKFGAPLGIPRPFFPFPLPQLQPKVSPQQRLASQTASNLRPNRSFLSKRTHPRELKPVSLFLKKTSGLKKERGSSYLWLWPDETRISKHLTSPATLAL